MSTGGDVSPTYDMFWGSSGEPHGEEQPQPVFYDEDGWTACNQCGSYLEDEAHSTDTGSEWEDAAQSAELQAYLGSFEGCNLEPLKDCLLYTSPSPRDS